MKKTIKVTLAPGWSDDCYYIEPHLDSDGNLWWIYGITLYIASNNNANKILKQLEAWAKDVDLEYMDNFYIASIDTNAIELLEEEPLDYKYIVEMTDFKDFLVDNELC